jgi:hypothetical protein
MKQTVFALLALLLAAQAQASKKIVIRCQNGEESLVAQVTKNSEGDKFGNLDVSVFYGARNLVTYEGMSMNVSESSDRVLVHDKSNPALNDAAGLVRIEVNRSNPSAIVFVKDQPGNENHVFSGEAGDCSIQTAD